MPDPVAAVQKKKKPKNAVPAKKLKANVKNALLRSKSFLFLWLKRSSWTAFFILSCIVVMSESTCPSYDIVVAGGGAAGFFAAIHAKQTCPTARVVILEKSRELLAKVAISGGGRCNVTHHCFDPKALIGHYPRGGKELLGAFHRFQPSDTIEWFESRGVDIKTEADGRMFPVSDDSGDIIRSLETEAHNLKINIWKKNGLLKANPTSDGFQCTLTSGETVSGRILILATGGNRASGGWAVAEQLGHRIHEPVPSLFSFHVQDPVLQGLAGVSVDPVEVTLPEMNAVQSGPLLITHKGLSGPAILKLSAWQARELSERNDHVGLKLNWIPEVTNADEVLKTMRMREGARSVVSSNPFRLPRRLWERLCRRADVQKEVTWSHISTDQESALLTVCTAMPCTMRGKTLNKEEFVTCGGVDLKEVDMKSFRSRLHENLFFAGEVLDIDGVTGGFNFQAAWTGGYLAGTVAGDDIQSCM